MGDDGGPRSERRGGARGGGGERTADEARETVGEPEVSTDWPRRLDPEGPGVVLVEDID
jgi:hypothetical protein